MNEPPYVVAFLDASVLYPALLRNLLMYFAAAGLYQARWSSRVHGEWMSALLRNRPDISRAQIERTRRLMESEIDDALVDGYDHRIATLTLPDADDRHILAAAIEGGAQLIVTANLRDFPPAALESFGLVAEHPDDFMLRLLSNSEAQVLAAFGKLCANRKNPQQSPHDITQIMTRQGLAKTAAAIGMRLGSASNE
jgi:hypothetical protein